MSEKLVRDAVRKNIESLRVLFESVKEMDSTIASISDADEKEQLKKRYSEIVESLNKLIESYEKMIEASIENDEESE